MAMVLTIRRDFHVLPDTSSKSNFFFNVFLLLIGLGILAAIIILKSLTAITFSADKPLFFYTVFVTSFQLSRLLGAMLYKKTAPSTEMKADDYEPTVTFVIPCKNEEASIEKTVRKCFEADYPKNKLEVIIINDGSTDGTQAVLEGLKPEYPNLIVENWAVNQGKRNAMACGFRKASGDIVVQLDSDSYIVPYTFRHLITPFADPRIGAVCAHADPENADTNLLTKMQAAYYFMSFRILKAAESTFLSVFCCSGCSSAYRKNIVLPIMDEWLGETFLGKPVTWGDDRALTNWVLRQGFSTIYTDEVKAYTICPDKIKQFLKQQVRWKKGWFVNSIFASKFIFKRDLFVSLTYFYPLILVTLITPFMATRAFIYNPIVRGVSPLFYVVGIFLVASAITVYYRYISRENKYWPYVFVWSGFNMVILSFILFYALATIQNRRWGTR